MNKDNIPNYIIPIKKVSYKRGKKAIIHVTGDDRPVTCKYIRSSIQGIKAPKIYFYDDEFYIFKIKEVGIFMIEKSVIYEQGIALQSWGDFIEL